MSQNLVIFRCFLGSCLSRPKIVFHAQQWSFTVDSRSFTVDSRSLVPKNHPKSYHKPTGHAIWCYPLAICRVQKQNQALKANQATIHVVLTLIWYMYKVWTLIPFFHNFECVFHWYGLSKTRCDSILEYARWAQIRDRDHITIECKMTCFGQSRPILIKGWNLPSCFS